MRVPALAACVALAALAAACGDEPEPPRVEPEVALELGSPADGAVVRSETVEISGTVRPRGARVKVLGREVAVDGGGFSAEVPLEPGANLIDVAADARGRRPDFAVARIVREVRLPVPDLAGPRRRHRAGPARGPRPDGPGGGRRRLLRPDPARATRRSAS